MWLTCAQITRQPAQHVAVEQFGLLIVRAMAELGQQLQLQIAFVAVQALADLRRDQAVVEIPWHLQSRKKQSRG